MNVARKRAVVLSVQEQVATRCVAPVSHVTLKWTTGMLTHQPQRLNERQRTRPEQCSLDAAFSVEGKHLCRRHAGMEALDILLTEEKMRGEI